MWRMQPRDDEDPPESGNIFGWKISTIGLIVILLLTALVAYRHYVLDLPIGYDIPSEQPESKSYYHDKADKEKAQLDTLPLKRE